MPERKVNSEEVNERSIQEMSQEVLLRVNNIDAFYGSLQVLWDVSLEVKSGEIVAIAGANVEL